MSIKARALLILGLVHLSTATPNYRIHRIRKNRAVPIVECSFSKHACWQQGLLAHADASCHAPLAQGPCPEGQWFVLPRFPSSAEGQCAALPCPADRRSPACRALMAQAARACAAPFVHFDPAGLLACGPFPGRAPSLHQHVHCRLPEEHAAVNLNGPPCVPNDAGECARQATGTRPRVPIEPED